MQALREEAMTGRIVNGMTTTCTVSSHEYVVQFQLSAMGLERLAREKILGVEFKKNKYKFANELAEFLAVEIAEMIMNERYER